MGVVTLAYEALAQPRSNRACCGYRHLIHASQFAESERLRSEEEYQLRARAPLTDETLDFTQKQWDSIFGFEEEEGVPLREDSVASDEVVTFSS